MRTHVLDLPAYLDARAPEGEDLLCGVLSDDLEPGTRVALRDQRPDLAQQEEKTVNVRVVIDGAEEQDRGTVGRRVEPARLEVLHVY